MNFPRLSIAALVGTALLVPFNAARAGVDPAQPTPDTKLSQLQKQVSETCALDLNRSNGQCDSIMAVMLEYQKQMNRDAREDRQLSRKDRQSELDAKQQRLDGRQRDITVEMQEAGDRRDAAAASSSKGAIASPCGSTPNPCPKPCATQPCR